MSNLSSSLKCNLVLHPNSRGWIIEKMANRLAETLSTLGADACISPKWSATADVNHFMIFHYVQGEKSTTNTMLITHVDDGLKIRMVKDRLREIADIGICMSCAHMNELVMEGVSPSALCFISPAHDGTVTPRRISIGITTNLYGDGRKREHLLHKLSSDIELKSFSFEIYGSGWSEIATRLRQAGALVNEYPSSPNDRDQYERMTRAISSFDYYLYLGLDEGSMGTLDALAAGVKTIITPQGFHLDLPNGITHPVWTYEDLRAVFIDIGHDRSLRIAAVSNLTWTKYAQDHLNIWNALRTGRSNELSRYRCQSNGSITSRGRGIVPRTWFGRYLTLLNSYRWSILMNYYLPRARRIMANVLKAVGIRL